MFSAGCRICGAERGLGAALQVGPGEVDSSYAET